VDDRAHEPPAFVRLADRDHPGKRRFERQLFDPARICAVALVGGAELDLPAEAGLPGEAEIGLQPTLPRLEHEPRDVLLRHGQERLLPLLDLAARGPYGVVADLDVDRLVLREDPLLTDLPAAQRLQRYGLTD